jgi:hypothetical protein
VERCEKALFRAPSHALPAPGWKTQVGPYPDRLGHAAVENLRRSPVEGARKAVRDLGKAVENCSQAGPLLFFEPQPPFDPEGRDGKVRRRHPTPTAKRWLSLSRRCGKKSETGPDQAELTERLTLICSLITQAERSALATVTLAGKVQVESAMEAVGSPWFRSTGKLIRGPGGSQSTAARSFLDRGEGRLSSAAYTLQLGAAQRQVIEIEGVAKMLIQGEVRHQADVPAEEALPQAGPRLPQEDAFARRAARAAQPAPQGPAAADALAALHSRRRPSTADLAPS